MDGSNNLEACQSACEEDKTCSAINFYSTGGCTLRACDYPMPVPSRTLSNFVGYYKLSGIKWIKTLKYMRHIIIIIISI